MVHGDAFTSEIAKIWHDYAGTTPPILAVKGKLVCFELIGEKGFLGVRRCNPIQKCKGRRNSI
jgi:hypothetical protein